MLKALKKLISKVKINVKNGGHATEDLESRLFDLPSPLYINKRVKTMAFHLPQFYEFEENNQWWGEGFTEWTNVVKARPIFDGHYQPRLPHDIGFYDLSKKEQVAEQVKLALSAGIDGFCFYYYYLSGKKLLRVPVDHFMDLDTTFEFCFCWANENWTRRWDGAEHQLLIRQLYDEKEIQDMIVDISRYMLKPNYLKIEGRPLFILYEPPKVPDLRNLINTLREGIGRRTETDPYIGYIWRGEPPGSYEDLFDIAVSFPLHYPGQQAFVKGQIKGRKLHSYPEMMKESITKSHPRKDVLKCCIPSWDNTARLHERASVFYGSHPDLFGKWYAACLKSAMDQDQPVVFVNAWNEWAEGNHLEPDQKYGYANLNRIWTQQQERNLF